MRGATGICYKFRRVKNYFNPHAPCGARLPVVDHVALTKGQISIHTPHAGRDPQRPTARSAIRNFNPHAPCGARRGMAMISTPSSYFNPHAPCGARPMPSRKEWVDMVISIHTPHAGRDAVLLSHPPGSPDFNPHAPCGARLVSEWQLQP